MAQVHHVPILFHELRPAETLLQVIDALKSLEGTCKAVFDRIQSRVDENRKRVQDIEGRIAAADTKIKQIEANPSRATTVMSLAKYPAEEALDHPIQLYSDGPFPVPPHTPVPSAVKLQQQGTFINNNDISLMETHKSVEIPKASDGLGRLPSHIPSISSLLLFNTVENPYRYVTTHCHVRC